MVTSTVRVAGRWVDMDDHERELRRLRLEARDRRLDIELAEAELAASQTRLTDLLCDWAARGHHLRLDAADRPRSGHIVHVGDSVVTMLDEGGGRDLVVLRHVEGFMVSEAFDHDATASDTAGATPIAWHVGHPRSLVAHLRSLVGEVSQVVVERRSTDPMIGQVVGVAETHVIVRLASGGDAAIPLDAIVAVSDRH